MRFRYPYTVMANKENDVRIQITLAKLPPSPYICIESVCLADMNVFARFDEIPPNGKLS